VVLALALCGVLGAPAEARPERHKWWLSEQVKSEVGLTDQQSKEIEQIFQAVRPRLKAGWEELDRLEQEVSHLMTEGESDEGRISTAIDRVEAARAALNKTRTLMLFRIYRVLSPEQRVKLKAFHERRDRERRQEQEPSARPR
jgi:Spy/CpxP family protein refolding chaperone